LALLAFLSMVEFFFPKLKWLTFPAMVTGILLLVGVQLVRRVQGVQAMVRRLRSRGSVKRADSEHAESAKPIEPR
jgi:hypothetical protein